MKKLIVLIFIFFCFVTTLQAGSPTKMTLKEFVDYGFRICKG